MAARRKTGSGKRKAKGAGGERPIEQYEHKGKQRANNPPVGLVTPESDRDAGKKTWAYDPHLDPQLQWSGKAEHTSFEVPTVSLHGERSAAEMNRDLSRGCAALAARSEQFG